MAECGAGLEIHAFEAQKDRKSWREIETSLGREFALPPAHLTKALYIPRHDATTTRFSVYDFSASYADAVRDLPIGSSQYLVALSMVRKPESERTGGFGAVYNVDFSVEDGGRETVVSVRPELQFGISKEAKLTIGSTGDDSCFFTVGNLNGMPSEAIPMTISHPIEPSNTRDGIFPHPYFTFQAPDKEGVLNSYEWQAHPIEHGRLRYTLVRMPAGGNGAIEIYAIYHHGVLAPSLSLPYSEGVLLLSPRINHSGDLMVIASALGMLWRLRETCEGGRASKGVQKKGSTKKKARFSGFGGILRGKN